MGSVDHKLYVAKAVGILILYTIMPRDVCLAFKIVIKISILSGENITALLSTCKITTIIKFKNN